MGNLLVNSDASKDAPFGPLDAKLAEYAAKVDCLAEKIYFHQQKKLKMASLDRQKLPSSDWRPVEGGGWCYVFSH